MSPRNSSRKQLATIHVQTAARYVDQVSSIRLRRAARAALVQQGVIDRVELTIVVTGNAQLRTLNRRFRHIDAPTDVLSFAGDDEPSAAHAPVQAARYLGDIVISYPKAQAQAKTGGHASEAELQLLVVHGVLHLLGYDHETRAEQLQMWRAQSAILKHLGAAITGPSA